MRGGSGAGFFWVGRLHSLSGLLLCAAYVLFFLLPMSAGMGGAASFNNFALSVARIPFIDGFMSAFILIPLFLHAVVGLSAIYGSQFNTVSYGFYRNWMYALERLTGIILIPFVFYHLAKVHLTFAFTGRMADFAYMQKLLAPGWVRAIYVAGVICAAFHIGNGISTAFSRLGIACSRRSQDAIAMAMWILTLVLAAWGVRAVYAF